MAVRKRLAHPEVVRQRIQTSQLVNRLTDHAHGHVEMTSTQVTAALGLLRKSLPDLTAITHSGSIETTKPEELSDERLAHIAAGSSSGASETPWSEEEPREIH
jgi:hypothetical protein